MESLIENGRTLRPEFWEMVSVVVELKSHKRDYALYMRRSSSKNSGLAPLSQNVVPLSCREMDRGAEPITSSTKPVIRSAKPPMMKTGRGHSSYRQ